MSFFQLAFSLQGRMRRCDFWLGQILISFAAGFIVLLLLPAIGMVLGLPRSNLHVPRYVDASSGAFLVIRLLLFWPVLAIAVKRGHDRNRPAGWIISLNVTSVAVEFLPPLSDAVRLLTMIAEYSFLAYVIVDLGLLDGSNGANRFGPSPKRPTSPAGPTVPNAELSQL
jgi:uncharacterized membrane protein YhaH (DUF805 family)